MPQPPLAGPPDASGTPATDPAGGAVFAWDEERVRGAVQKHLGEGTAVELTTVDYGKGVGASGPRMELRPSTIDATPGACRQAHSEFDEIIRFGAAGEGQGVLDSDDGTRRAVYLLVMPDSASMQMLQEAEQSIVEACGAEMISTNTRVSVRNMVLNDGHARVWSSSPNAGASLVSGELVAHRETMQFVGNVVIVESQTAEWDKASSLESFDEQSDEMLRRLTTTLGMEDASRGLPLIPMDYLRDQPKGSTIFDANRLTRAMNQTLGSDVMVSVDESSEPLVGQSDERWEERSETGACFQARRAYEEATSGLTSRSVTADVSGQVDADSAGVSIRVPDDPTAWADSEDEYAATMSSCGVVGGYEGDTTTISHTTDVDGKGSQWRFTAQSAGGSINIVNMTDRGHILQFRTQSSRRRDLTTDEMTAELRHQLEVLSEAAHG